MFSAGSRMKPGWMLGNRGVWWLISLLRYFNQYQLLLLLYLMMHVLFFPIVDDVSWDAMFTPSGPWLCRRGVRPSCVVVCVSAWDTDRKSPVLESGICPTGRCDEPECFYPCFGELRRIAPASSGSLLDMICVGARVGVMFMFYSLVRPSFSPESCFFSHDLWL